MKYFQKIVIPITWNILKQFFIKHNVAVTVSERNYLLRFLVSRFLVCILLTTTFFAIENLFNIWRLRVLLGIAIFCATVAVFKKLRKIQKIHDDFCTTPKMSRWYQHPRRNVAAFGFIFR